MTARAISQRDPGLRVTTDIPSAPGSPVPPQISGYRPDIVARRWAQPARFVIAEAKTDGDVDNRHTRNQIEAFVSHLATMPYGEGTFVLAVSGRVADAARAVLRFSCRDRVSCKLQVTLFDGLDFWILGAIGAPLWRLC